MNNYNNNFNNNRNKDKNSTNFSNGIERNFSEKSGSVSRRSYSDNSRDKKRKIKR